MAEGLSEEKKKEIKELFDLFDADQSGTVSLDELAKIVRGLGHNPTEADLKEMFAEVDKDGSGHIDINEFTTYCEQKPNFMDVDEGKAMRHAFMSIDKDGKGYIDAEELYRFLKDLGDDPMSDNEIKQALEEFVDAGGKIDYNEFLITCLA
ncbi:uncharacterized protein LOC134709593 [Mytilus trossulus]|uniref:uncharacterized protein LOC134709593 n=1 Tax=Mytilus trossulus TaxID=6551 RepID=UPI0030048CF2